MTLELSQDQVLLKATVDRFFADRAGRNSFRHEDVCADWNETDWTSWAELGLLALPFPEEHGGLAGGPVDVMLVMEAIGRSLAPEPYLASVVVAGAAIVRSGRPEQQKNYIERIISGQTLLALAHDEPGVRHELSHVATEARKCAGGWLLSGRKRAAVAADRADAIIVSARTRGSPRDEDGIALFVVPSDVPGMERVGSGLLGGGSAADLVLRDVEVGNDMLLGPDQGAISTLVHLRETAIAAVCAEAVGVMTAMHEMTLEYLKTRRQFDVPIGSFQALQHRAVDMFIALEQARSMMLLAALAVKIDDPARRARAMAAAKVQIGRSGRYIGQQAVQLHGAMGMTRECRIGSYFRRMTAIDALYGNADHHLCRLAAMGGVSAPELESRDLHEAGRWTNSEQIAPPHNRNTSYGL